MKHGLIPLIACLLSVFPSGLKAQTDSLVDVFPLAIGNQWTYRYFTLINIWPAGNPVETTTDSGQVVYSVLACVASLDSSRWQFHLRRDLTRHQILWDWGGGHCDTIYPIRDSSTFELIENHQGQHQIYRNADPHVIHLDVFPFTKDFTDTTRIFRFRRVGPGDTISFRSAVPHVWPSLRSNFTFRRAVGLQSFSYNSGTVDVFDTASHDLLGSVITSTNETTERRGPESFDLSQNYPNPFNPSTNVEFRVKNMGFVSLKVYDVLGREVATLVNEVKPPGVYEVEWDATGMASGVYFYRLSSGAFVQTRKMIVAR